MTLTVSHFRPADSRNYRRFDWKTPGSALEDAGKSDNPYWDDPEQTAANYYDTIMATDFKAAPRKLRDYAHDPRNNPLLNANRERDPQITERWMRTVIPMERNQPGTGNAKAREFFDENFPNATTRRDKAMAWDSLARSRQEKNQRPAGFLSGPLGMLAMSALTAAFGGPLLSAAVKAGTLGSLGAYLPAIKVASGAKTISDFVRASKP